MYYFLHLEKATKHKIEHENFLLKEKGTALLLFKRKFNII